MQYGTPQDPLGWGTDPGKPGWLTLRYRKVYKEYLEPNKLTLPLILTEVGIDGLVGNRPGPEGQGWQDFGGYWDQLGMGKDASGNYTEQLAWYDAICNRTLMCWAAPSTRPRPRAAGKATKSWGTVASSHS